MFDFLVGSLRKSIANQLDDALEALEVLMQKKALFDIP